MILFVGDLDRADRDREGFQEIDMAAFFGPSPNGRRGSTMRGAFPNMSPAPSASPPPAAPARWCSRSPRTCCATRSRRSTARRSRRRRAALRRGDGGDVRAAQGRDQPGGDHRRRRLGPRRGASFRHLSPIATASRPPPPSAARTRSATNAESMPASSATAPTPSCSSASARPTCCWWSAPGSARRPPTATSWSPPTIPDQLLVHVHPDPNELGRCSRPTCRSAPTWANSRRWPPIGTIPSWSASRRRGSASRSGSNGRSRSPRDGVELDLGPCVKAMRDALPPTPSSATAPAISRAGGTATGTTACCRPSSPRPAGRWATACPPRSRPRSASRTGRWCASPATAIS